MLLIHFNNLLSFEVFDKKEKGTLVGKYIWWLLCSLKGYSFYLLNVFVKLLFVSFHKTISYHSTTWIDLRSLSNKNLITKGSFDRVKYGCVNGFPENNIKDCVLLLMFCFKCVDHLLITIVQGRRKMEQSNMFFSLLAVLY